MSEKKSEIIKEALRIARQNTPSFLLEEYSTENGASVMLEILLPHIKNLIKIIESIGERTGSSLMPEFKKQFDDAKKLIEK
jgi:DNA replication protein DnaD